MKPPTYAAIMPSCMRAKQRAGNTEKRTGRNTTKFSGNRRGQQDTAGRQSGTTTPPFLHLAFSLLRRNFGSLCFCFKHREVDSCLAAKVSACERASQWVHALVALGARALQPVLFRARRCQKCEGFPSHLYMYLFGRLQKWRSFQWKPPVN